MDTGEVDLPYIGLVPAAGKTSLELALGVKRMLEARLYKRATVEVSLDSERTERGKVYVFGAVVDPGMVELPFNEVMTVSKVILRAGGLTENADGSKVRIDRKGSGQQRIQVNLDALLSGASGQADVVLQANDYVVVPNRNLTTGSVVVSGEVNEPGRVEMAGQNKMTLSDAIVACGNFTRYADRRRVRVFRMEGDESREYVVDVKAVLEEGKLEKDFQLEPGDRVLVKARLINF